MEKTDDFFANYLNVAFLLHDFNTMCMVIATQYAWHIIE